MPPGSPLSALTKVMGKNVCTQNPPKSKSDHFQCIMSGDVHTATAHRISLSNRITLIIMAPILNLCKLKGF